MKAPKNKQARPWQRTNATRSSVAEAADKVRAAMGSLVRASRKDPATFCQFTLRDEETGKPVTLVPMHIEWHQILSANNRAVLWSHTEGGKTAQISIGRVLWEIGQNPNIRILIISDTTVRAKKIVRAIKSYIETSAEYRATFPNVRPDKSSTTGLWQDSAFNVTRTSHSKDPTVQVVGFRGSILGARADLVMIDDYLTPKNTKTAYMRDEGYKWLKGVIESRRTKRARLWFIGNAWHRDDAMHRYAAEPSTYSKKFPVRDRTGASSWPLFWTQQRIDEEIENRGPIESRRSLFCDPASDAEARFKEEYITRCLQLGDGLETVHSLSYTPNGYAVLTGVDLAVTKKDSGDLTAIVTISVDGKGSRRILECVSGHWTGPEIIDKILSAQRRFQSIVFVENNGAQEYIKQFIDADHGIPIKAHHTGANKTDPAWGVESLATEMAGGKWEIPNVGAVLTGRIDKEIRALIGEMLSYDPASHTGDRLMALWIAREGIRKTVALEVGRTKRRAR